MGLILVGGCRHDNSEILMDAHELLGINSETFRKRLEEQFIVQSISFSHSPFYLDRRGRDRGYELQGQGIYIGCRLLDMVDLPGTLGYVALAVEAVNANMTVEEYLQSKEEEDGEGTEIKVVAIIEILLPYEVSKSAAVKMLGYQLGSYASY